MIIKTLYLVALFCLATCVLAMDGVEETGQLTPSLPQENTIATHFPLEQLPPEIIAMIYQYLTELSDKVNLSRANKKLCSLRPSLKSAMLHDIGGLRMIFEHRGHLNFNAPMDVVVNINSGCEEIKFIKSKKTSVKALRDCNGYCTDADLEALAPGLTQLEQMDLMSNKKLTHRGLAFLPKSLKHLNLRGCQQVTDAELKVVAELTQLQHLDLHGCFQVTNVGVGHLRGLTQLQYLNLTCCRRVTDAELKVMVGLTQLQYLNLYGCDHVTDAGVAYLAELTQLQHLNLTCCRQVTDAGLKIVAGLTQLQHLNLTCCKQVTDTGLEYLRRLTQLQHLNLFGCSQVTDLGVAYLAELTQLQDLNLNGCSRVTDSGVGVLRSLPQLKHLHLNGTQVSDVGHSNP